MSLDVAVIGSGFGGLGAAIRLRQGGVTTWPSSSAPMTSVARGATTLYPGCRCDVASNLYSFSFAPNPHWTNTYSYQPEIWQYLEDVADAYNLRELIKFDHDVPTSPSTHHADSGESTTIQGEYEAQCVILATGGLAEPRLPDIDGIENFAGADHAHRALG